MQGGVIMTSPPEAKAAEGDEGGEDPDPEQREHLTPRAVRQAARDGGRDGGALPAAGGAWGALWDVPGPA